MNTFISFDIFKQTLGYIKTSYGSAVPTENLIVSINAKFMIIAFINQTN